MNAIHTITPRLENGVLLFDDPARGISREPFVGGADVILIAAARGAGHDPVAGFPLLFSAARFPGSVEAVRGKDGETYRVGQAEGWLCPVTKQYFGEYPERIYFMVPAAEAARG